MLRLARRVAGDVLLGVETVRHWSYLYGVRRFCFACDRIVWVGHPVHPHPVVTLSCTESDLAKLDSPGD